MSHTLLLYPIGGACLSRAASGAGLNGSVTPKSRKITPVSHWKQKVSQMSLPELLLAGGQASKDAAPHLVAHALVRAASPLMGTHLTAGVRVHTSVNAARKSARATNTNRETEPRT
jgi:hypothetical protein